MKDPYEQVACAGVDVHHKFSNVTFRSACGEVVRRERLDHLDRQRLRQRLEQWPKGLVTALEASFGWAWLSDLMAEAGVKPHLSNCYKVEKMRKARGWDKTNRKDADLLSTLALEKSNWWEVWLVPREIRDRRERMRFRAELVGLQTQTKNRIHALFHRRGIFHEYSDLFGSAGRVFLEALCRDGAGLLTGQALSVLRGQVRMLRQVRAELATVTRQLRGELKVSPLVRRLKTIPGIGLILAHVLVAEIGTMDRFAGSRKLASYGLVAPRCSDSGEPDGSRAPRGVTWASGATGR